MSDLQSTVRLITRDDLEALTAVEPALHKGAARENVELAENGDFFFAGAFSGAKILGYVVLDCRPDNDLRPQMKNLWVFPQYRRKGLGVDLTRFIEEIAARQGFAEVYLSVDPENPAAIPLYISLDYSATGDHRRVEYSGLDDAGRPVGDSAVKHEAVFRKSLTMGR